MSVLIEAEYPNPEDWILRGSKPEVCIWQGRRCLRLGEGSADLAFLPDLLLDHGTIEADIGAEGTTYAGIAFRIADAINHELAYAQPHTSGKWDALQYDPVFRGSNTWQLYHGRGWQLDADVPTGAWFRLRVEFKEDRALIRLGNTLRLSTTASGTDQPPLLVQPLAHQHASGRVGLWAYLPAYFSRVRILSDCPQLDAAIFPPQTPAAGDLIREWFLEGVGVVACEPNGALNLARYLPAGVKEARISRRFELAAAGKIRIAAGYSDWISLKLDEEEILTGENLWHDTPVWEERGYVSPGLAVDVAAAEGAHTLSATLRATEYFGFGCVVRMEGDGIRWKPAALQMD